MHTAAGTAHSILCSADVCSCILVLWAEGVVQDGDCLCP